MIWMQELTIILCLCTLVICAHFPFIQPFLYPINPYYFKLTISIHLMVKRYIFPFIWPRPQSIGSWILLVSAFATTKKVFLFYYYPDLLFRIECKYPLCTKKLENVKFFVSNMEPKRIRYATCNVFAK